jgi:hypothetical protein
MADCLENVYGKTNLYHFISWQVELVTDDVTTSISLHMSIYLCMLKCLTLRTSDFIVSE